MLEINKISIDSTNFFEVEGTLDIKNKNVIIDISFEQLNKIFGIDVKELLFGSDKVIDKTKNIYVLDKSGKKYSCIGCIFSYNAKERIVLSSVAIDLILENTFSDSIDMMTKRITFKTYYLGHSIHSAYIKGYDFKYNSNNKVIINKYTDENIHIDITVENKRMTNYFRMSEIVYSIIEFIKLIFGDIPYIDEIIIETDGEVIKPHFTIVDKYMTKNKKRNGKEIVGCITPEVLNRKTLKAFQKFRKDTKIIYDLFMINTNENGYKEMQNCNLVQIMEGFYNTLIKPDEKLRNIIEYYFSNKTSRKLLTKRDKRRIKTKENTQIFIYKAVNHRHYLSHLNVTENKNVFYKLENIYAYWKISMCIRIFILEYLKINYDKKRIPMYTKEIEDWARKNKLRFSLKINSKK